ncbi:hypothetical protein SAMN04489725_10424 [Alicyclobacillus hesperidum]|uniref:Uncharacterized protein n=1 Tax=Alicyclobacillus hesperidum TaxID=89784 RepID=A0A1H2SED0_9BACL|nr:hypothetical protein [Alicyclobacillus hesperidum]SDW29877.1 hypothetical protein SAMN04489725_10424 [Alicyclobacillus hesperidum]
MDNSPISSGRLDRAPAPTQEVRPAPRLPLDRTDQRTTEGSVRALPEAALVALDEELFSLEQHIPYRLLQNPIWLKAEWAWKALLVQHLFTSHSAVSNTHLEQQRTLPSVDEENIPVEDGAIMSGEAVATSQSEQVNHFERAVQALWGILSDASESSSTTKEVSLQMQTDPPLLPFASVGNEVFAQAHSAADRRRIEHWTLQDRLTAAVMDNAYERRGAGLFFLPGQDKPPYRAVKWEAERRTRIGHAGKLVHRIQIDLEVNGSPVTCLITAQRPQMFVHFTSDNLSIHQYLADGRQALQKPLAQHGWELAGWSVSTHEEVF